MQKEQEVQSFESVEALIRFIIDGKSYQGQDAETKAMIPKVSSIVENTKAYRNKKQNQNKRVVQLILDEIRTGDDSGAFHSALSGALQDQEVSKYRLAVEFIKSIIDAKDQKRQSEGETILSIVAPPNSALGNVILNKSSQALTVALDKIPSEVASVLEPSKQWELLLGECKPDLQKELGKSDDMTPKEFLETMSDTEYRETQNALLKHYSNKENRDSLFPCQQEFLVSQESEREKRAKVERPMEERVKSIVKSVKDSIPRFEEGSWTAIETAASQLSYRDQSLLKTLYGDRKVTEFLGCSLSREPAAFLDSLDYNNIQEASAIDDKYASLELIKSLAQDKDKVMSFPAGTGYDVASYLSQEAKEAKGAKGAKEAKQYVSVFIEDGEKSYDIVVDVKSTKYQKIEEYQEVDQGLEKHDKRKKYQALWSNRPFLRWWHELWNKSPPAKDLLSDEILGKEQEKRKVALAGVDQSFQEFPPEIVLNSIKDQRQKLGGDKLPPLQQKYALQQKKLGQNVPEADEITR